MSQAATRRATPDRGRILPENYAGGTLLQAAPQAPAVQLGQFEDDFEFRFVGYRRCTDFDESNAPGQDAAALVADNDHVVGVVSDGVSQSFFGNIAAEAVTHHLVELLWSTRRNPPAAEKVEAALAALQTQVHERLVLPHTLSEGLNEMVRESLEATRKKGSQAVFSAFHLNRATGKLRLYQVGDVNAWVTTEGGTVLARAEAKGRWSSAARGRVAMATRDFHNVRSVVLASDGVPVDWVERRWHGEKDGPAGFEQVAEDLATRDDVSLVAWRRLTPMTAVQVAPEKRTTLRADTGPSTTNGPLEQTAGGDRPLEASVPPTATWTNWLPASGWTMRPGVLAGRVFLAAALFLAGYLTGMLTTRKQIPVPPPPRLYIEWRKAPQIDSLNGWMGELFNRLSDIVQYGEIGAIEPDDVIVRITYTDQAVAELPVTVRTRTGKSEHKGGPRRFQLAPGVARDVFDLSARDPETGYVARTKLPVELGSLYEVRVWRKTK